MLLEIEPPSFFPVGFENKVLSEKLSGKVDKIMKSGLKVILPVYKKGQVVKVAFPKQEIRFGVVTSTRDAELKSTVLVSFKGAKAVGVHKNFICVPRISPSNPDTPVETVIPEDLAENPMEA